VTALTISILIFTILMFVLQLFRWLKIEPSDVKKFITVRGRTIAWNVYLVIAILITIYFLLVLSIIVCEVPFSISVATLIVLVLWALLGTWAPAIQRLRSKRANVAVLFTGFSLLVLMVVGFWIAQWPETSKSIFVTILLVAIVVVYIVDRAVRKRKASRKSD
jgi:hypothetical protein